MKKVNQFIVSALMFLLVNACVEKKENSTGRLFERYEQQEGFFIFDAPPKLVAALIEGDSEEDIQFKEVIRNLSQIKVLVFTQDESDNNISDSLHETFHEYYKELDYGVLAEKHDAVDNVDVLSVKNQDDTKEIVVLMKDEDDFLSISLSGIIDQGSMDVILKEKNIERIKHLRGEQ